MSESLTGDPSTDAVVPAATRLIWAVRESDAAAVDGALDEVVRVVGGPGMAALAVVLAAMVPDDRSPRELLAWLADPAEYRTLRHSGLGADTSAWVVALQGKQKGTR